MFTQHNSLELYVVQQYTDRNPIQGVIIRLDRLQEWVLYIKTKKS